MDVLVVLIHLQFPFVIFPTLGTLVPRFGHVSYFFLGFLAFQVVLSIQTGILGVLNRRHALPLLLGCFLSFLAFLLFSNFLLFLLPLLVLVVLVLRLLFLPLLLQ
eukprot:Lithocolla_globosa_v1_NODE_1091_length_2879_cov_3.128895.p4 type:complete len:105 gc:universal NODE_1091_length_2879_cov_3.128895:936-1250(+)